MSAVDQSIPFARHQGVEPPQIAARLERLPMTGYQRKLFVVIATAWLADQINVALLIFLLGALVATFHLTLTETGLLASMVVAGQLVGNVLAGWAADRYGRRIVFQLTMLVWGVASLLAASSWSVTALLVFRFIIGIGVGGEAPVAQAMVSEFMPAAVRGRYIALMEGFWAVGFVFSGAISYFLLPIIGWRGIFVIVGLLSAVLFFARRFLPESPRWLLEKGRTEEAEATMRRIEAEVERRTGKPLPFPEAHITDERRSSQTSFATLFSRQYLSRTIMAFGLWFFALLGYFGLSTWLTVLLKSHGFSNINSVGFVTLITLGGIPGFAGAGYLLEKIGRKPTTALFLLASAGSAFFYGNAASQSTLFISGFIMQFFMFGMWCCLYAYTPELFPTRARATGAGLASAVGRVGGMLGPMIVPLVLVHGGQAAVFELSAGAFGLAAMLVVIMGVETRGMPLEMIAH